MLALYSYVLLSHSKFFVKILILYFSVGIVHSITIPLFQFKILAGEANWNNNWKGQLDEESNTIDVNLINFIIIINIFYTFSVQILSNKILSKEFGFFNYLFACSYPSLLYFIIILSGKISEQKEISAEKFVFCLQFFFSR